MIFSTNHHSIEFNSAKPSILATLFVVILLFCSSQLLAQREQETVFPEKYYWELCYLQKEGQLDMASEERILLELQQVNPVDFQVKSGQAIMLKPGLYAVVFHSKSEKATFQKLKRQSTFSELRRNIEIIDKRLAITAK